MLRRFHSAFILQHIPDSLAGHHSLQKRSVPKSVFFRHRNLDGFAAAFGLHNICPFPTSLQAPNLWFFDHNNLLQTFVTSKSKYIQIIRAATASLKTKMLPCSLPSCTCKPSTFSAFNKSSQFTTSCSCRIFRTSNLIPFTICATTADSHQGFSPLYPTQQ